MPALGLGVFQTPPTETASVVEAAIDVGYRLIDAAAAHARGDRVHRRARHGVRGGPEPDGITLDAYGLEIPDA